MYRVLLIVLIVSLVTFWMYPKENITPVVADDNVQQLTDANSKVEIYTAGKSVVKYISDEETQDKKPQLSANQIFELAKELRLCKSVPKSDSELSIWLDNANNVGEPNEYIEDVIGRFDQCSKLPEDEQNYINLMLIAAEQGSDDAVSLLWAIGEQEYFESFGAKQFSREERIATRVAFTQKKYDLAHKVALRGGEQSLERLVKGYQNFDPATNGQSYYKSVAYANFAMAITRNNDLHRKVDWIKQRLLTSMSNDEQDQAQILTGKLLSEALIGRN